MVDETATAPAERDEKVGHKRPPRKSRFRKGQSGNPKGRPPRVPNVTDLLCSTLAERVTVKVEGRRRSVSRGEAMARSVVDKIAGGDPRLLQTLFRELARREAQVAEEMDRKTWIRERRELRDEVHQLRAENEEIAVRWAKRFHELQGGG